MIDEGFAREYNFKGQGYKFVYEFEIAERLAELREKGLWFECYQHTPNPSQEGNSTSTGQHLPSPSSLQFGGQARRELRTFSKTKHVTPFLLTILFLKTFN